VDHDDVVSLREMSKRTILIAVDPSECSRKAVTWANENFLREDDLVVLCHVYYLGVEPSVRRMDRMEAYQELQTTYIEHSNELVHDAAKSITVANTKEMLVLEGVAREVLLDTIAKYQVDSVVLGSRGFGGMKGMLLGSVSSHVAQHSPVPVFVIH
jgi:nucleotide-binding universal stress UspA family protein